jgi:hypothetical protein
MSKHDEQCTRHKPQPHQNHVWSSPSPDKIEINKIYPQISNKRYIAQYEPRHENATNLDCVLFFINLYSLYFIIPNREITNKLQVFHMTLNCKFKKKNTVKLLRVYRTLMPDKIFTCVGVLTKIWIIQVFEKTSFRFLWSVLEVSFAFQTVKANFYILRV